MRFGRQSIDSSASGPGRSTMTGRLAGVLFLVSGMLTVVTIPLPVPGANPRAELVVAVAAVVVGLMAWFAPWDRLPQAVFLALPPLAFTLIAIGNLYGGESAYVFGVFFVVAFTWIGVAFRPWTSFWFAPPATIAFIAPIYLREGDLAAAASSAALAIPVCVLVAEALARLSSRNIRLVRQLKDFEAEHQLKALRQELEEEVTLHRSLLDLGARLGVISSTAPRAILPALAQRLTTVVPMRAITVYVADHAARLGRPIGHYEAGHHTDEEAILGFLVPFGMGATGRAVLDRQSVISNVGENEVATEIPGSIPIDEHLLAVPVLAADETRAVLTLRRPGHESPFTPTDARRAELFAQHVASVFLLTELEESRRLLSQKVEELQELNRMKDELVANVSHELRTPLTSILGNLSTVARLWDALRRSEARGLLTGAERQARRLAELLENLLAESRLAGRDPAVVPVFVPVRTFLEEIRDALEFRDPTRSIEIKAAGDPLVMTDRAMLYRILFNLGDNALKYSDGPVTFAAQEEGGGVRIDVTDKGVGIAPENLPRIFEQFEQLDGTATRRFGGVGLGLHLCVKAAAVLGGRISVDSTPGHGSRFSLWLPDYDVGSKATASVGIPGEPRPLGHAGVENSATGSGT